MKSSLLLLTSIFIGLTNFSQIENWYGSDLGTLGYKFNNVKFEKRDPNYTSPTHDYSDSSWLQFKGGSTEFAVDLFSEHVYFHLDGSVIPDMIIYGVTGMAKKEDTWLKIKDVGKYDQGKFFPIRLGFGDNITPYFNLYAGGQWQYSFYTFTSETNKYESSFIGANQYGFGIHGALAVGPVLVKQSVMKDWVSRASTFKGNAMTYETSIYAGLNNFGVFMKFNWLQFTMKEGEYSVSEDKFFKSSLKADTRFYKEQNMNMFTFSVGIYAAGLFSGVATSTSDAIYKTETGLRNERNQDKRNKIEWKE